MKYSHHFLTNAILRIDFVTDDTLMHELSQKVKSKCAAYFSISEEQDIIKQHVHVDNSLDTQNVTTRKEMVKEWAFRDKDIKNSISIGYDHILMEFKIYKSFSDFKHTFFEIYEVLIEEYPSLITNRVGLRYIDQIDLTGDKSKRKNWKTYWNNYISSKLVNCLGFADDDDAISRQMNTIEMNYSDHNLHFQYGIFNVDYPAPIKKPVFILDTDIYAIGNYNVEEIKDALEIYHDRAKKWFESSIKDKLREKMGVNDAEL